MTSKVLNCILEVGLNRGLNQLEHLVVGISGNEIPCYVYFPVIPLPCDLTYIVIFTCRSVNIKSPFVCSIATTERGDRTKSLDEVCQ